MRLKNVSKDILEKIKSIKRKRIFVISDTHFFHKNILKHVPIRNRYKQEGFSSHEEWLVNLWNKKVGTCDIVLHLGDFSFRENSEKDVISISKLLKGGKFLILGNHDLKSLDFYKNVFDFVIGEGTVYVENKDKVYEIKTGFCKANGLILEFKSKKIMFTHYPVFPSHPWDTPLTKRLRQIFIYFNCDINIHGHVHNKNIKVDYSKSINVSVEAINFSPVELKDLI